MKKLLALLAALVLAGGLAVPALAGECLVENTSYSVGAKAAVVMEAQTGRLLFAQEADTPLPMASTTKIMTALLALEQENIDEEFVVDPAAIRVEGSSMGLTEGDTVTLRALTGGMLMASGNDGANAVAVRIAGDIPAFAELMNARAAGIGMENTHFVTPSGLDDPEHYSTARDMALLAREALKNPVFAEMSAARRLSLTYGNPPYQRTLSNHNRLLSLYPDAIGVKTGFTKKSGRCLVSAARRDGVTLIVVTLSCGDDWNTHKALYERYFPKVGSRELKPEGEIRVPVTGGTFADVEVRQISRLHTVDIRGQEDPVNTTIYAPNFLYAPVLGGDIVGKIVYDRDGTVIGESLLAAVEPVPAKSLPVPDQPGLWEKLLAFLGR